MNKSQSRNHKVFKKPMKRTLKLCKMEMKISGMMESLCENVRDLRILNECPFKNQSMCFDFKGGNICYHKVRQNVYLHNMFKRVFCERIRNLCYMMNFQGIRFDLKIMKEEHNDIRVTLYSM